VDFVENRHENELISRIEESFASKTFMSWEKAETNTLNPRNFNSLPANFEVEEKLKFFFSQ
jgi:hypothetical protein